MSIHTESNKSLVIHTVSGINASLSNTECSFESPLSLFN